MRSNATGIQEQHKQMSGSLPPTDAVIVVDKEKSCAFAKRRTFDLRTR